MWYVAEYEPTTLFSLRPANATTSGGKTLVTPTPFAVKMGLLDVAIRLHGVGAGERWFPRLRDLEVAIRLPRDLTVIKTFVKILRPHHSNRVKDVYGTGLVGRMGHTIAYREMVHFGGSLSIALRDAGGKGQAPPIKKLLPQISYLGKRGGFMQCLALSEEDELAGGFTLLNGKGRDSFNLGGLLQLLDDCGPKMTFAHANIYDSKRLSVGKPNGRVLNTVVLDYRLVKSSRSFSWYEKSDASELPKLRSICG